MTLKAQILICIVLVIALLAIVNMVRKRSLELKYVLVWIGCDLILFIFTLFPNLMQKLANALGIYSPVNMILLYKSKKENHISGYHFYINSCFIQGNCQSKKVGTDDSTAGR